MAKTTETICCPHHFELLKDSSVQGAEIKSVKEEDLPRIEKNIKTLADKMETRSIEEEGYRQTVRMLVKSVEELEGEREKYIKRGELRPVASKEAVDELGKQLAAKASKEGLDGLSRWVIIGWVATIAAFLLAAVDVFLRLRGM
ncbi:MAG: hypothetical protein ABFE07_29545 [Armatimonadia bacterium]